MRKNNKYNLCETCKTGKLSYELDNKSPFCPYMIYCKGEYCSMYQELEQIRKRRWFHRFKLK